MKLSVGIRVATFRMGKLHQNMSRMSGFAQRRSLIAPVALLLLATSSCSRPTPTVPTEGASQSGQTPLQGKGSGSVNGPEPAALIEKATPDAILPFQTTQVLPAGSLLTVRLTSPITTETEGDTERFEAVVDDPVIFEGKTLIPRGSTAVGKVGAAPVSKVTPDRGYVRLSLESVNLDGFHLPLRTAVLFARQSPGDLSSRTVRLEEGHRLTFRLTEPFYADVQHAQAGH